MRKYIESVVGSDKPMICAVSHSHPDHAGSAILFDEAYINELDMPRLSTFALDMETRLHDLSGTGRSTPEVWEYIQENIIDNINTEFKNINEGDIIDLGGVKLEAILVPGHSLGLMAFYNTELYDLPLNKGSLKLYHRVPISEHVSNVTVYYSMTKIEVVGVIEGKDKVLVINSTLGPDKELRKFIESFVGEGKPIICACTSGEYDVTGGAYLFDEAYVNERDFGILSFGKEQRLAAISSLAAGVPGVISYCDSNMVGFEGADFKNVDEGDIFDLGGVTAEPIRTPGVTQGHLCYYCREDDVAYTGTAVNLHVDLKDLDREGLKAAADSMDKFAERLTPDTKLISAHTINYMPLQSAKNIAIACREVLEGKIEGDLPGVHPNDKKPARPTINAHFRGNCCILYDTAKI